MQTARREVTSTVAGQRYSSYCSPSSARLRMRPVLSEALAGEFLMGCDSSALISDPGGRLSKCPGGGHEFGRAPHFHFRFWAVSEMVDFVRARICPDDQRETGLISRFRLQNGNGDSALTGRRNVPERRLRPPWGRPTICPTLPSSPLHQIELLAFPANGFDALRKPSARSYLKATVCSGQGCLERRQRSRRSWSWTAVQVSR